MNDNNNTESVLYAVGTRGYSAYEVAVQNGFVGTEQEWLDSLVGPQGPQGQPFDELTPEQKAEITGPQGKSAYEIAVEEGYEGTEEEWVASYINATNYYDKEEIDNINNIQNGRMNDIEDDLESEINTRQSQVSSLQSSIATLGNGSPKKVYSTLSDLTTADPDHDYTYVVAADGKWYYYDTDNSQWTEGGIYQASVDLDKIQQEEILLLDSNNIVDPLLCKDNTGITSAAGVEVENVNAWVTDYCEIDLTVSRYITSNYVIRKICAYDENKTFLGTLEGTTDRQIRFDLLTATFDNTKYIRIMIEKYYLSYENRFNFVAFYIPYLPLTTEYYKMTNGVSILDNSLVLGKMNNKIINGIFTSNILINQNPLTKYDFYYGTISNGELNTQYLHRLIISKNIYFIPANINIKFTNEYYLLLFEYNADGTYKGRITLDNTTRQNCIISHDGYYRFVIRNVTEGINIDNVSNVLAGMTFTNLNYKSKEVLPELLYEGEKINTKKHTAGYKRAGFGSLWQDSCQYNGKAFIFNNVGEFKVVNIASGATYTGFRLGEQDTIKPHCNCVCFSNEFYNESDPFPLLYVNAYNNQDLPKGTCYVHRILVDENNPNSYSTQLIQTINIGFTSDEMWTVAGDLRNYGNFLVDTDKKRLIVYTLRNHKTRFFIFNLPNISNSQVTLNISDIIEYFDCPHFEYIQGGHYFNGKVYSLDGIDETPSGTGTRGWLHVFDMNSKSLVSSLDLWSLMHEPESIFMYNDKFYIAESDFYIFDFE